ncbi:MAG: hypothetical protein Q4B22_05705 [Eubacteriales bacterium]|nr:hypothetical protein [Eubacteriales bacterium]
MKAMVNRCPSCGGTLQFDSASGKLKCPYCESVFDPGSIQTMTDAGEVTMPSEEAVLSEEVNPESSPVKTESAGKEKKKNAKDGKMDAVVYTCPNCGAEITCTELAAVEYCLYCGSFVTLQKHMTRIRKPDLILPFAIDQEACRNKYSFMLARNLYAPSEFRKKEFLNRFKGIYIPFWTYEYTYGPNVQLDGVTTKQKGDYLYEQHYDIFLKVDGKLDGVSFDASSNFDDTISSKLAPFERAKMKPFDASYIYGYFADTADVEENVYRRDADQDVRDKIWREVTANIDTGKVKTKKPDVNQFDETFHVQKKAKLSMLPVWFLTWRKDDRVAYSVVNGDTGKIYAEIPIDIKRYLGISLLTAVILFCLLNLTVTFNVSMMLKIALFFSLLTLILYQVQTNKMVQRITHTEDKGYLAKNGSEKTQAVKKSAVEQAFSWLWDHKKELGIGLFALLGFLAEAVLPILFFGFYLVIPAVVLYVLARIVTSYRILKDKRIFLDVSGSVTAMIMSGVILFMDPAADIFYYAMAVFSMAAIAFTAVCTMLRYNDLVTRPVPHFFERTEGSTK